MTTYIIYYAMKNEATVHAIEVVADKVAVDRDFLKFYSNELVVGVFPWKKIFGYAQRKSENIKSYQRLIIGNDFASRQVDLNTADEVRISKTATVGVLVGNEALAEFHESCFWGHVLVSEFPLSDIVKSAEATSNTPKGA